MRWYYQQTTHDRWNYDVASPPLLFDALDAHGRHVPAVGEAGKTGWLYVLDRRNGALLRLSRPFIPQTHLYAAPSPHGILVQPGEGGGAIGPAAYDPALRAVFVAGNVAHELLREDAVPPWPGGSAEWQSGSQNWVSRGYALVSRICSRSPTSSSPARRGPVRSTHSTRTAGSCSGKRFRGRPRPRTIGCGRAFRGHGSPALAPPIAYAVGDREYVVIGADLAYSTLHPNGGDTLYAFALPPGRAK